jgi:hypothetical protein
MEKYFKQKERKTGKGIWHHYCPKHHNFTSVPPPIPSKLLMHQSWIHVKFPESRQFSKMNSTHFHSNLSVSFPTRHIIFVLFRCPETYYQLPENKKKIINNRVWDPWRSDILIILTMTMNSKINIKKNINGASEFYYHLIVL